MSPKIFLTVLPVGTGVFPWPSSQHVTPDSFQEGSPKNHLVKSLLRAGYSGNRTNLFLSWLAKTNSHQWNLIPSLVLQKWWIKEHKHICTSDARHSHIYSMFCSIVLLQSSTLETIYASKELSDVVDVFCFWLRNVKKEMSSHSYLILRISSALHSLLVRAFPLNKNGLFREVLSWSVNGRVVVLWCCQTLHNANIPVADFFKLESLYLFERYLRRVQTKKIHVNHS